jgi:hypothetical protein
MVSSGLGWRGVGGIGGGFCEHGNETFGFVKCGLFLD